MKEKVPHEACREHNTSSKAHFTQQGPGGWFYLGTQANCVIRGKNKALMCTAAQNASFTASSSDCPANALWKAQPLAATWYFGLGGQ